MVPPTAKEVWDGYNDGDEYESVLNEIVSEWRHGIEVREVFRRESDGTFWEAHYRKQPDGFYHGLKEGDAGIAQVWPKTITIVKEGYTAEMPTHE